MVIRMVVPSVMTREFPKNQNLESTENSETRANDPPPNPVAIIVLDVLTRNVLPTTVLMANTGTLAKMVTKELAIVNANTEKKPAALLITSDDANSGPVNVNADDVPSDTERPAATVVTTEAKLKPVKVDEPVVIASCVDARMRCLNSNMVEPGAETVLPTKKTPMEESGVFIKKRASVVAVTMVNEDESTLMVKPDAAVDVISRTGLLIMYRAEEEMTKRHDAQVSSISKIMAPLPVIEEVSTVMPKLSIGNAKSMNDWDDTVAVDAVMYTTELESVSPSTAIKSILPPPRSVDEANETVEAEKRSAKRKNPYCAVMTLLTT